MKKTLFIALMAVTFSANAAVSVSSQSALVSALSDSDKDITITASFTTSQNITIPAGYTVTLADGVTLTLGTSGVLYWKTYYTLSGAGSLVTGTRKVVTTETRTLPTVGGDNNRFSGMTYEVTDVVSTGGSVSKSKDTQLTCSCKTSVSVDGGTTWVNLDFDPVAISCSVSSGINGGRTYVGAYSSFEEAYNAVKFQSSMTKVMDGKVIVLLRDSSFTVSEKVETKGVVVDCAGFSGKINSGIYELYKVGEFANNSFVTFLNASTAAAPKITNSGAVFINCENASVHSVNCNTSEQTHVYDCGVVNMKSGYPDTGGAYFYCGGPYDVSFSSNYKIYGGTYTSDPSAYVQGGFEAVQGADGNWTVQEEVQGPNAAAIGDVEYETLQSAVDAAVSGAKITLLSDIQISTPVTIAAGKNLTIELDKRDIVAENGVFINDGSLKIEYSAQDDNPSTLSTASGNLIVNNGTLEITYGTYAGDILLNAGKFIVHGGTFDGTLAAGPDVTDPKSVADIRGGSFKNSVESFLSGGFIQTAYGGYNYVGEFPYAILTSASIDGYEAGWKIEAVTEADRAIYRKYKSGLNLRSNFTDDEWYRCAELLSMITPYENDAIDCVVVFSRAVKAESIKVYVGGLFGALPCDLAAGEPYRAFSSQALSVKDYHGFLTDENFSNAVFGIKNLSDENAGTLCTLEFQLCSSQNGVITGTKHVLARITYRFPWAEGDAIPELREDDSAETVASALEGTADARVTENVKDVASYNSYRTWAAGVTASGTATAAEVKAAPNAWLSYALNTTNLVETPVAGDLKVESLAPSASEAGAFKLELSLKDVDIGTGAASAEKMQENFAKVFGIEGATSLEESAFSKNNVVYTFGTPVDGKVTVEAKPAVSGGTFFMRAKMAP